MIDKARLEQKCSMWNIALTGTQLDQLDAFARILVDYNQKVRPKRPSGWAWHSPPSPTSCGCCN